VYNLEYCPRSQPFAAGFHSCDMIAKTLPTMLRGSHNHSSVIMLQYFALSRWHQCSHLFPLQYIMVKNHHPPTRGVINLFGFMQTSTTSLKRLWWSVNLLVCLCIVEPSCLDSPTLTLPGPWATVWTHTRTLAGWSCTWRPASSLTSPSCCPLTPYPSSNCEWPLLSPHRPV